MPGMMYEGGPEDDGMWCTTHRAWQMFHTCSGGQGEPMGYCSAWDGSFVGGKDVNGVQVGGEPSCNFVRRQEAGDSGQG